MIDEILPMESTRGMIVTGREKNMFMCVCPPQIHMDRLGPKPGLYSESTMTKRDEI